jgi:PAS domain S-box-containing protein
MILKQDERLEGPELVAARSEFDVFNRNPDPALDELTGLAAVFSGAEFAYIGWMEMNRLWFKSRHGFQATEQPRSQTGCQWTLERRAPLLIRDAGRDARFPPEGIDLAGVARCRSYAGVPLIDGAQQVVGTLAVLSREPNLFAREQIVLLEILARQVMTRLELYARINAQEQAQRARLRTERALAVERCFVAATLDSIPALLAVLDTAGRMVRLNDACAQLTGLSLADAVGRPFADEVLDAGDRAWAAERLVEAADGQISGPHETAWRPREGPLRRVSWTLRPLAGPDGEIQFLIVSGQDVTGQREAERALLSSEARYRQVVEGSLGFVFTCSLEGRLTSLNEFTADTLGYRVEELNGRSVADILDPTDAAIFQQSLRALESGQEWQGALRVRRSDGSYRRIAFRSRRMNLPGDQPFVLSNGMDVTEQYDAEEALRLATRQRELILESAGDGIFGMDMAGRLTFINKAGARTLGYNSEQLTGRDVHELIQHSHADGTPYSRSASPMLQALRRQEQIGMRDEVFWREDGTAIPVEYSATPLIENGQVSGAVVAFQDISERRRLEKMKDEFISTVSHELRTPLTSLRASLGLLAGSTLEKRPEKRRQMVEMAIGNCDRLVRLVNGILDFDSFDKGRLTLNCQPFEAIDLLRRAVDSSYATAMQARIDFHIESPPVAVMADEERALQVLNELVANSIKFSAPETLIRLTAKPLSATEVCFTVEDQGPGIEPEKLEHIFDRFQQGDASDTRALGGAGLGLALCRSIVELHGGRIWAESAVGLGSRFMFTLPVAPRS